ncbi:hypothetical protein SGUI_1317 [Serinicoccus hydrothermalis]|uniref:Uncharacterized protein n=1 Tax=Serinicoccus hydrothermalis TaxID=1758689 RepID=A0A1B1NBB0_9MICO|nr:hypothetical protein SGUI_1317 [Serinicoccus hydrothermalis]
MRVVRWPAQQQDRDWCAQRAVPCLLLVEPGRPAPEARPTESVLPQSADQGAVARAVDELSRRAVAAPRPTRAQEPVVLPTGRRRSVVGLVAALF